MNCKKNQIPATIILILLLVGTQCTQQTPAGFSTPPSWRGITIGTSTPNDVETVWGEPIRREESSWGHMVYRYPNDEGSVNLPHLIYIDQECNCVVRMLEDITTYDVMLDEILEQYGEPETIMSYEYDDKRGLFIYAAQGVAVFAETQEEPYEAIVYEIWYFLPMTVEDMLVAPWSERLTNWLPSRWQDYQYDP